MSWLERLYRRFAAFWFRRVRGHRVREVFVGSIDGSRSRAVTIECLCGGHILVVRDGARARVLDATCPYGEWHSRHPRSE
jgi:hypothetical protein|nr:hypothetical protein [Kofleriaceae bacterium]